MRHRIFAAAVLAMSSMGAARGADKKGAEKICWEDASALLAPSGGSATFFRVNVVTLDGVRHSGRTLYFRPDSLQLLGSEAVLSEGATSTELIRREDVGRIEIRRGKRFFDFTVGSVSVALLVPSECAGSALACLVTPVVFPAGIAVAAGSAPVTLAVDGVHLMLPPKVYEIVH